MTPYFAKVRFTTSAGPYYPALISFTASDFRDAGAVMFAFIAGFEIAHSVRIAVEEISVNKPRGLQPSIKIGSPIEDPGLEIFLKEHK